MLKSSLFDYSGAYILIIIKAYIKAYIVKGKITITVRGADAVATLVGDRDKGAAIKNCAPFSEINKTQTDNAKDIDIVMPMYSLIEYSNNHAKTSGSLWQYYRDDPNDNLSDSKLFKF